MRRTLILAVAATAVVASGAALIKIINTVADAIDDIGEALWT